MIEIDPISQAMFIKRAVYRIELRIDLRAHRYEGALDVDVSLHAPQASVALRVPSGSVGRAEALFDGKSWAAAHYFRPDAETVQFEFSEALPAEVRLVIPFAGELSAQMLALFNGLTTSPGEDLRQLEWLLPHFPDVESARWQVRSVGRVGGDDGVTASAM